MAEIAARLARLALGCVQRAYPVQPGHVVRDAGDLRPARELHPAFYGCYDWHSAVHGHWLLAHVLCTSPGTPEAAGIRRIFDQHFLPEHLAAEANYLYEHPGFERPYGWAWMLK